MIENIFDKDGLRVLVSRIQALKPDSQRKWGKMNVAQMLAHCNVGFELAYESKHPAPGRFKRFMLKTFVKKGVVNEVPYKKNSPTASVFKVASEQNFIVEQQRLISFLERTHNLSSAHFEGKAYVSFGRLTSTEWNNLFAKHLDHHLTQFGV